MYRALTEKLLSLPDLVRLPAHLSGSEYGRYLSATPVSTVGDEGRNNTALICESEAASVAALTSDIPPASAGQPAIVAADRAGRPPETAP